MACLRHLGRFLAQNGDAVVGQHASISMMRGENKKKKKKTRRVGDRENV